MMGCSAAAVFVMEPINTTAVGALRTLLADQPTSAAKVAFAWQIAAGPALARAATHDVARRGRRAAGARPDGRVAAGNPARATGDRRAPPAPARPGRRQTSGHRQRRVAAATRSIFLRRDRPCPVQAVMRETVIVSAVRTPTGKFLGGLKDFQATDLGAMAVREAVRRAGIDPGRVDECILGNVVGAGLGQAPARQAALKGGLSQQRRRAHDQQGLRLGPQGRDARRRRGSPPATSTSRSPAAWSR